MAILTGDYVTDLQTKQALEAKAESASLVLADFPKGQNGLTPNSVRVTSAFRRASSVYAAAFKALREVNGEFLRLHRERYRAENRRTRA